MSRWQNITNETVSPEHEAAVLKSVMPLLKQNKAPQRKINWLYLALPSLALGAAAVFFYLPHSPVEEPMGKEIEIALDFEVIQDLHEIENLELLQKLGDPEKWRTKKPKKS